jgi:hypothetical protein
MDEVVVTRGPLHYVGLLKIATLLAKGKVVPVLN